MSITNGQAILAVDLNGIATTALTAMQADAARKPLGHYVHLAFKNLVASSSYGKAKFVAPFDCFVETIACQAGDMVGAVTVDVTGDGVVSRFPLRREFTAAAGTTKGSRLLYDGTKGSIADLRGTSRAVRVFNRGSTITVTVSTASVAAAAHLQVLLLLRSFFGRDA